MPSKITRQPIFSADYQCWAIPLTRGVIALVDEDLADSLGQNAWYAMLIKGRWYSARGGGRGAFVLMHRAIMTPGDGMDVDHREHFPLEARVIDNRRSNLRTCSHANNQCNIQLRANKQSPFKGLVWHKVNQTWRVRIYKNGKNISLGCFVDPIKGAQAYDTAAIRIHGEFAVTNASLGLI